MNKNENLELVINFGDLIQLEHGTSFGFFASQFDRQKIADFCNYLSNTSTAITLGWEFTNKLNYQRGQYVITARRLNINIPIVLMDHTIYFDISDDTWSKIHPQLFTFIQREWRKFLARNIEDYKSYFNRKVVLSGLEA